MSKPNLHYFEIQHYVPRIGWVSNVAIQYSTQEKAEQQLLHYLLEHPTERAIDYRVRPIIEKVATTTTSNPSLGQKE